MANGKTRCPLGFGFAPAQSAHAFALLVDPATGSVVVEERFTWGEAAGDDDDQEVAPEATAKAILDAYRWARIAPTVAETFNARLRAPGLSPPLWPPPTPPPPHPPQQLTLLV